LEAVKVDENVAKWTNLCRTTVTLSSKSVKNIKCCVYFHFCSLLILGQGMNNDKSVK